VSRLTHAQRNAQDDARMLMIACALNTGDKDRIDRDVLLRLKQQLG